MVWSKLIQRLDSAISMISLFSSNNANKFITHTHTHTHTLLFLKMIVQELIDYP
jgi:hypothetical protein